MKSIALKRRILAQANLYLILDASVQSYEALLLTVQQAIDAGADIVQLRAKNWKRDDIISFSKRIHSIVADRALYIVNDDPVLAKRCEADGVHLGQADGNIDEVRRFFPEAIIGRSCQTLEHITSAQQESYDYIGLGSIFKTLTKPDRQPMDVERLKVMLAAVKIPTFLIGGVSESNLLDLTAMGASRVAVCRDILLSKNIDQKVTSFKKHLKF